MATIRTRTHKLGATLSEATAIQYHAGAGVLMGMSVDYDAAANAATTIKMYDTILPASTAVGNAPSVFVGTGINTDLGLTVPVRCYTDGDLPAGTSTANVKLGVPFCRGLYVVVAGDVTGPQIITLWIKPCIAKAFSVATTGTAGSAVGATNVIDGPGLLHAIRFDIDPGAPSTTDILVRDSNIYTAAGAGTGATLLTKTDISNVSSLRPVVTLTEVDEVQATVSTAATGAYANDGILFASGLNVSVQQCNALAAAVNGIAVIER